MSNRPYVAAILLNAFALLPAWPAFAVNEIIITHAKALAGNVTSGDAAGYPVRIGASGSYVLGSNLTPPVGQTAIQIFANNVTIDLSGYVISGSGKSAWNGIVGAGGRNGATIKNGTIEGFKFDGINGAGRYWIVDNIRSVENGGTGIGIGHYAVIKSSVVVGNASFGINAGVSSVIQGNTVSDNGITGIQTIASTVVGNTINENNGYGLTGGGYTGYSGNTLVGNNATGGFVEAAAVLPQHPNVCQGTCP